MSKKFLKQLGNIVVLQAAGYAVGEAFKVVIPKVKRAMGIEEDEGETPTPEKAKEVKKTATKEARETNKNIKELIDETKKSVAKKQEQTPVEAKDPEVIDDGEESS